MFKLKTRTLILLVTVGILETWLRHVVGFAHPKSEFLLDVDGNSVATAREHLCVIEKKQGNGIGGRARCFGADHIEGRTQAPQDIDFVQVVAGLFFSCGIAVDQTVHCWGSITRTVPGLYTQISTDSGSFFACGVLVDGTINCWGFYDYKLKPPSPPNVKFTQISCAEKHCCALDDKGYPYCWGERVPSHIEPPKITYKEFLQSKENAGWLIRPEPDEYEDDGEEAPKLSPHESEVSYVQFRQISVGESISCGVTLLGSHLLCWGDPVDFFVHKDLPRQHKGPYRQVSVGSAGVCAIRADIEDLANEEFAVEVPDGHLPDRLECWGPAKSIINQYKFDAWDQVSVGSNYVCGVSMDSEVECGGYIPGDEHKNIIIA